MPDCNKSSASFLDRPYPEVAFSALAMIIVPIAATFIFGDKLNWSYWIGAFLIFSGIVIIAR